MEVLSGSLAGNAQADQCACIDAATFHCCYGLPAEPQRYQNAYEHHEKFGLQILALLALNLSWV